MTFGERLFMYMKRANMTQKRLAEILDITPARLNYWVKDKREPEVYYIKALAEALNVSGDDLLGIEGQKQNYDLSKSELDLLEAYRKLDAPGKAVVQVVLETQQQRIREYGPAAKS